MDYKEKYLKLKSYILEDRRVSGKLNPLFVEQLSNLSFVVHDNILGDDARAVILSLVEEFNRISGTELRHNLELSQYFAFGNGLTDKDGNIICENCEIVLRHVDTTVCITNGHIRQHDSQYDHTNKFNEKTEIDCNISRGLVRFYIKQRNGSTFTYTRIRVVNVQVVNSLHQYADTIYQNNDEINKLEAASIIAMSKGQSDAISATSQTGQLEANTPAEIVCATNIVNNIVNETKNSAVRAQMSKMNNQRIMCPIPTQSSVNAANTVAKTIMKTNTANVANMTAVLVPNNEPIPLQSAFDIGNVPAIINSKGIVTNVTGGGTNTMNSRIINSRSSFAIDSNLAIVPTNNIVTDKSISVAAASNKSATSITNQLIAAAKNFFGETNNITNNTVGSFVDKTGKSVTNTATDVFDKTGKAVSDTANQVADKTGEVVTDITNKIKDFFAANPDKSSQITTGASIVPVSKNLSVMTPLPANQATNLVPVPQNDNDIVALTRSLFAPLLSQKTALKRFENKLIKANASSVSINRANQATQTVNNGNYTVKRTQETLVNSPVVNSSKLIPQGETLVNSSKLIPQGDTSRTIKPTIQKQINTKSDITITSNRTIAPSLQNNSNK